MLNKQKRKKEKVISLFWQSVTYSQPLPGPEVTTVKSLLVSRCLSFHFTLCDWRVCSNQGSHELGENISQKEEDHCEYGGNFWD